MTQQQEQCWNTGVTEIQQMYAGQTLMHKYRISKKSYFGMLSISLTLDWIAVAQW